MTPPKLFGGATVLVTGAGGSIGSEICRALVALGVSELRMLGHSEAPLYEITKELSTYARVNGAPVYTNGRTRLVPILGSICDEKAVDAAVRGASIVIHAAAHKHVPLCEENPLEAILNNIGGTMVLTKAASALGVKRFVQVSTDKAVRPTSVMGMTKRVCERWIQRMARLSDTEFTIVRFGNVLNSSGSVLPLWREQLRAGKPITITDKRCTRYFMSIPEAVKLTLSAATLGEGTFVLDMGEAKSIYRMALELLEADKYPDFGGTQSEIIETGLRPGEKIHEELTYGAEAQPTEVSRVLKVTEPDDYTSDWVFQDIVMAAKVGAKDHALMAMHEVCQ